MKSLRPFLLLFMGAILFLSCEKEKKNNGDDNAAFDKEAMLDNVATNIIIPSYEEYKNAIASLQSSVTIFKTSTDEVNLLKVQEALLEARIKWQSVSAYEFGPASSVILRANTNTYPTDSTQVMDNLNSGNYNLQTAANLSAKGLPALDLLLHGMGSTQAEMVSFFGGNKKVKAFDYLEDVVGELNENVNGVFKEWTNNYSSTFSSRQGNDVGSSLGLLINELNFDWELLKNFQIGIPAGKKTLGEILPEKVESLYAKNSAALAKARLRSIKNLYLGKAISGTDGLGLHDYLIALESNYNGGLLADAILAQINKAEDALSAVDDPFQEQLVNNLETVNIAYREIQKTVVLLKTDMPSALGVLITYQDNDGD